MLFDRLCAIIERQYRNPVLLRLLRDARIFEFPGRIHERAEARQWEGFGGKEFMFEHFFLPFPVIAIEDTASCIVLVDDKPNQRGLNCPRLAIEIIDIRTPIDEFGQSKDDPEQQRRWRKAIDDPRMPKGASTVAVTKLTECRDASDDDIKARTGGTGLTFAGISDLTFVATKDAMVLDPYEARTLLQQTGAHEAHTLAAIGNAVSALEEVMFFNTPDHFIVERAAVRPRKPNAKGLPETRRTHERPSYILLRPAEIRARLGLTDDLVNERKSPTPHARRRHFRTLSSDRFTNAHGKVIVVNASWVGPTEGVYKGRNYRICLEL